MHLDRIGVSVILVILILVLMGIVLLVTYPAPSASWFVGLGLILGALGAGGGYFYVIEND